MKRFTKRKAERLHDLLKSVDRKIEDVNCGGCGIFAYYLAGTMIRKGYRCQIICLDRYHDDTPRGHRSNLRNIAKKDRTAAYVYTHLCLKIGNYFLDSNKLGKRTDSGIFNEEYIPLGTISRKDLKFLLSITHKWNYRYNRSQNDKLRRLINRLVERLD